MGNYIILDNISKKYNDKMALNNVSFQIKKGRCTGLLGINGAGKTTTLKILIGLINASEGKIIFHNEEINPSSINFKKKIGYLAQAPRFYDWMSGYEFLSYIAALYKLPHDKKKKRIDEVLNIVNLENEKKKKISKYSGGMKQRLGIAQAILHSPSFLILDEPVSALDPEGRYQIINLLKKLKENTTILFSTHILHDADSICDDIIILHNGKKIIDTELIKLKNTYSEPIIKITLADNKKDLKSILDQYEWIEEINIIENLLTLRIKEQEKALKLLPIILLDNNSPFTSFKIYEPQLEDIFLKLVNNK